VNEISFLVQKKSKVFCGIRNANHVRAPSTKNDSRGEKKFYAQPNRFSRSTTITPPPPLRTISLSCPLTPPHPLLHSLSQSPSSSLAISSSLRLYTCSYIFIILYTYVSVAFFISRHVSKKVTLPEWHIFLAGTINSHHTKITSRTMNNGPYFDRDLFLRAARKPYIRNNTHTTDRQADLSFPRIPCTAGNGLAADAVFVSSPNCYHLLLLIILVLAICQPQSQQRNKNKNKRACIFFLYFFFQDIRIIFHIRIFIKW